MRLWPKPGHFMEELRAILMSTFEVNQEEY